MCFVSYVGDYARDTFPQKFPHIVPQYPMTVPVVNSWPPVEMVPRYEFEALKKEVDALKELLKAAQIYDAKTNQPHCEHSEKVAFLKKMAEYVGVDLSEVLK